MVAEPRRQLGLETHLGQIGDDRLLEVFRLPADGRVVGAWVVVGTTVINVFADAAPFELATDTFPGNRLAAVGATQQTARQWMVGSASAAVATVQNVLAGVERGPIDQALVATLEDLPVPRQFADVEAVADNVGERRAVEPGLAGAENVSFALQHVGERLEGVPARGVEIENADQRPRLLRVRLDRFVLVFDVDVAVGGEARWPSLPHLLVHPLEHFRPQIVAVVLGDRSHHVERQRSGGTGAELVIDERQLDAAGIFELLKADGISHVTADAVELVAEDRLDLLLLSVGLHPGEHLVECDAFRTPLRRLGHDELANNIPPVGLRPLSVHAKLGI